MNVCSVCRRPDVSAINLKLGKRVPIRRIVAQHDGVTEGSLQRHKKHMIDMVAKSEAARKYRDSETILSYLERQMEIMSKTLDACDRYLTDPDNPQQYDLGPRAEDIMVIYDTVEVDTDSEDDDEVKTRKVRRKAKLSELICGIPNVFQVQWKTADQRELVLKAAIALRGHLEFIAELIGLVKAQGGSTNIQINVFAHMPLVRKVLEGFPEAFNAVDQTLREVLNGNSGS